MKTERMTRIGHLLGCAVVCVTMGISGLAQAQAGDGKAPATPDRPADAPAEPQPEEPQPAAPQPEGGAPSPDAPDGQAAPAEEGPDAAPHDGPTEEEIAEARARYRRGTELYQSGDFKLALIEFDRAYKTAPSYRILYNIGQVNMQLNNYAKALTAFERYLAEGGEAISAERREALQMELGLLRGRTAKIAVTSDQAGAEVRIDGIPVGVTPLELTLVDAGEHNVTVSKDGRSQNAYVELAGKEEKTLEIILPKERPITVAPNPTGPKNVVINEGDDTYTLSTAPIVGWIVTGALTAAAVGTGVAAYFAQNDLDALKEEPTTASRLDDASGKATALSVTTDVLIVSAVAAGAVSLYLTLTDEGVKVERDDEATARLGFGPGGVSLSGTF